MAQITLNGRTMATPQDFYEQFFTAAKGLFPDYGGRNLDALHDDLSELSEPLTIRWFHSQEAAQSLGGWFDRCYATLVEKGSRDQPVTVSLE